MIVDKKLNLVLPVERPDGTIYVHSTPVSHAVFKRYFMVMSKTFARIHAEGLSEIAGPRIAALMLRQIAEEMGVTADVELGFFSEIRRLSNVTLLGAGGWSVIPLQDAVSESKFDEDELSEVENALTFFTVASAMYRKPDLRIALAAMSALWQAQTTSLNSTEFASSLPKSTPGETTGETAAVSSVAY